MPEIPNELERWHKSLKGECIRPGTPPSLKDEQRLVEGYVAHYNNVRLNSAIGYITPKDTLAGRQQEIHAERDRKFETARKERQIRRWIALCWAWGAEAQLPVYRPTARWLEDHYTLCR